ncbi:MAG: hypothetical protein JWP14_2711 [Frankiales bacterium]|nr:hypothetical protein [Frankiales bacterium]
MRKYTKILRALGAYAVVLSTAGFAYAYWTTTGSGSGNATAGTNAAADPLVISQVSAPTGLVPGGTPQDVLVTVNNTAAYSQSVGSISATPTYPLSCGIANWTVTPVSNSGATLAATTTSSSIKVATIGLNDLGTGVNQNGCKNAVVSFAFSG